MSARAARSTRSAQAIEPREQLVAQRLDAIDGIGRALMNPLEPLLLLRQPAIDALEPLQDLRPHLFQPQHAWQACHEHAAQKGSAKRGRSAKKLQEPIAVAGRR